MPSDSIVRTTFCSRRMSSMTDPEPAASAPWIEVRAPPRVAVSPLPISSSRSERYPIPWRRASTTPLRRTSTPSMSMRPSVRLSAPTSSATGSAIPKRRSPVMPRTSPARMSRLTGARPRVPTASRSSMSDPPLCAGAGRRRCSKVPPNREVNSAVFVAAPCCSSLTSRPSRMTSTRSASAATSSRRWEMLTMARPSAASLFASAWNRGISWSLKVAVISSRRMSCVSAYARRSSSTTVMSARSRSPRRSSGSRSLP